VRALDDAGRALGAAAAAAVNLVDVDTVVLGGFPARLAPWVVPAVEAELKARVLAAAWQPVRVLVSRLGAEAAVRGAAAGAVRQVAEDPAVYLAASR
jgi:predicted NBD/HSP70 family sugar kinase